ncbi:hypothetical protein [Sphingobacterium humi]|uniref:Uncharacterized protein n=1 Tax=Sphingobacterium humi TaxID=1796905 RepID=A0A6N8KU16_9SPHI|nr:hypothetical protein [Sphingobacterium humi]MVZ60953.1 hypothetical protein [Sphingobacterium humi]
MKYIIFSLSLFFAAYSAQAQQVEHIQKLEIAKKKRKSIGGRDSTVVIRIDTLIMKDQAKLEFFGKKDVKLEIGHAIIGNKAVISGTDGKNNATNFDIKANIQSLGSLYVIARGWDAMNGTKTFPNGDGGEVKFAYASSGIVPQTDNKKGKNYLMVDVQEGGLRGNPTSDLRNIYSQIQTSAPGLRGIPQGQVYSGSPGKKGKVEIKAYD